MRPVLDNTHYQGIYPSSSEIQCDLQAEELRFGVLWNHGRVDRTIICPKSTTGGHEKDLLNPKLGLVFVADGNMIADSDAAPKHTENIYHEKAIRVRFDGKSKPWVEIHEAQTAHAGKYDASKRPDRVYSGASGKPSDLQEECANELQVVRVACVPQNPSYAKLECLGIEGGIFEQFQPVSEGNEQRKSGFCAVKLFSRYGWQKVLAK